MATITGYNGTPVSGVPLEYLVYTPNAIGGPETVPSGTGSSAYSAAQPEAATLVLSNQQKKGFLAAVLTVTGSDSHPLAISMGELDGGFGNNPALLTLDGTIGYPTLVFPQDRDSSRTVPNIYDIGVTVVDPASLDIPAATTFPPYGSTTVPFTGTAGQPPYQSVVVRTNRGETVRDLWVSQLATLPQVKANVSFAAGSGTSSKTETGPTLAEVLHFLNIEPQRDTAVWATGAPFAPPTVTAPGGGNSTYSTAVTPAEAGPGHRPLLISLAETAVGGGTPDTSTPRLIPDGDVAGARYNSNFATLTILNTGTNPELLPDYCPGPGASRSVTGSGNLGQTASGVPALDDSTEPARPGRDRP